VAAISFPPTSMEQAVRSGVDRRRAAAAAGVEATEGLGRHSPGLDRRACFGLAAQTRVAGCAPVETIDLRLPTDVAARCDQRRRLAVRIPVLAAFGTSGACGWS